MLLEKQCLDVSNFFLCVHGVNCGVVIEDALQLSTLWQLQSELKHTNFVRQFGE